jgi:hypothetical protein
VKIPRNSKLLYCLLATTVAGCAVSETATQASAPPEPDTSCASETVLLDAHFETGNLGVCAVSSDGRFTLALVPEDAPPINPSAWFAFRASGSAGDRVDVELALDHGYARYWPKISRDGETWQALPPESVTGGGEASKSMTFHFALEGPQAWIAGQEILDSRDYRDWIAQMDAVEGVSTQLLGRSVQGRPVLLAETEDKPELVLLIGRQHPPEVTGAIGMDSFLDTVFSDSELAVRFRNRFKLGVVPFMNPDGVAHGHWRHNAGGTDLNRDWGPFRQPETQAVIAWVEQQESEGRELKLVLDFHSTWEDLFYTQPAVEEPLDFASAWLNASRARLPDFPFRHVQSTDFVQPNSKNYFHNSRGIPAITYEVGDDTDRDAARRAAVVFAEEMMRTMLAR